MSLTKRDMFRRKIVMGIVLDTGTRESLAQPFADAVMRVLDQEKSTAGVVYVPEPPLQYDALSIESELRRGHTPRSVCKRHGIGRRTLNRMFPGGLPRPENLDE